MAEDLIDMRGIQTHRTPQPKRGLSRQNNGDEEFGLDFIDNFSQTGLTDALFKAMWT